MENLTVPKDAVEFELVIKHNVVTREFSVSGHSKNLLVAQGILKYAEQLVGMEIAQARVAEQIRNAPRIQVAPRLLE